MTTEMTHHADPNIHIKQKFCPLIYSPFPLCSNDQNPYIHNFRKENASLQLPFMKILSRSQFIDTWRTSFCNYIFWSSRVCATILQQVRRFMQFLAYAQPRDNLLNEGWHIAVCKADNNATNSIRPKRKHMFQFKRGCGENKCMLYGIGESDFMMDLLLLE